MIKELKQDRKTEKHKVELNKFCVKINLMLSKITLSSLHFSQKKLCTCFMSTSLSPERCSLPQDCKTPEKINQYTKLSSCVSLTQDFEGLIMHIWRFYLCVNVCKFLTLCQVIVECKPSCL